LYEVLYKNHTKTRANANLYPNSHFCREKVEIPISAVWKSLPKQPFLPGKGRDSNFCRLEISTQTAIFAGKR